MNNTLKLKDDPYYPLPAHLKEGLERYLNLGISPGGFMEAVLCNDLENACGRADSHNINILPVIVGYIYNNIPSSAWGSIEKYSNWLNSFKAKRD